MTVIESHPARAVKRRAQYLTATTNLLPKEAETLAWREQGYSHAVIAKRIGITKPTVDDYLARVVAQHGLTTVETKSIDDCDGIDLDLIDRETVAGYHVIDRRHWYDAASTHLERSPAWFQVWIDTNENGGESQ